MSSFPLSAMRTTAPLFFGVWTALVLPQVNRQMYTLMTCSSFPKTVFTNSGRQSLLMCLPRDILPWIWIQAYPMMAWPCIHRMQIWRTTRSAPGTSCMKMRLVRPRCFVLKKGSLETSCFVDSLVCLISLCLLVFVFLNATRRDWNCPTFASKGKYWIHGIRWAEGSE